MNALVDKEDETLKTSVDKSPDSLKTNRCETEKRGRFAPLRCCLTSGHDGACNFVPKGVFEYRPAKQPPRGVVPQGLRPYGPGTNYHTQAAASDRGAAVDQQKPAHCERPKGTVLPLTGGWTRDSQSDAPSPLSQEGKS